MDSGKCNAINMTSGVMKFGTECTVHTKSQWLIFSLLKHISLKKKENRDKKMGYTPLFHLLGMNAACFTRDPLQNIWVQNVKKISLFP